MIVTYHPDPKTLGNVLAALRGQADRTLIVDNGSDRALIAGVRKAHPQVEILAFESNRGLAAAQNSGIEWAKQNGATHVLLLDQDSIPQPDMVRQLFLASGHLEKAGKPVAAAGPRITDARNGRDMPFVRFGFPRVRRHFCGANTAEYVETDFLISSGMLVRVSVFDRVGKPDESLFIDNVDLEWCFRASRLGFGLYGVCGARLMHSLGDNVIRVGNLATVYRHSPARQYYMMRNRVILYQKSYSPACWIIQDMLRMLLKTAFATVFFPDRTAHIRMIACGILDGLRTVISDQ